MEPHYRIAMIASECMPYIKTGGLADVVGSLPKALQALGHQVIVILPKYRAIDSERFDLRLFFGQLGVWMGNTLEWCSVYRSESEGFPVFFIEFQQYFDRWGLYHDEWMNDYADNPRRFAFLTRAALQLCKDMQFNPHVVHVHDWQTALAPAYLKIWHWNDPSLGNAASLLTIHNIAYQGVYPASHMDYLGLQWENFKPDRLEDHGNINFLKSGIFYADMLNTVSPTYAEETRSPEGGKGMAPYILARGSNYVGILNGVDYERWNPETDPLIPAKYSAADLSGKTLCKRALQERFHLDRSDDTPIIGVISRLAEQKGLDLLARAIEDILRQMRVQFAIIGSGDKKLEAFYRNLPAMFPGKVGSFIGYHEELSHWVEAGADFFLMPSIFEPSGLNQLYSLKYGTTPIVRATGGLDDSVDQYDEKTGMGTGFKFWEASPRAIYYTTGWAVSTYYDRPAHLQAMIRRGMQKDFSWRRSAELYELAYRQARMNAGKLP